MQLIDSDYLRYKTDRPTSSAISSTDSENTNPSSHLPLLSPGLQREPDRENDGDLRPFVSDTSPSKGDSPADQILQGHLDQMQSGSWDFQESFAHHFSDHGLDTLAGVEPFMRLYDTPTFATPQQSRLRPPSSIDLLVREPQSKASSRTGFEHPPSPAPSPVAQDFGIYSISAPASTVDYLYSLHIHSILLR